MPIKNIPPELLRPIVEYLDDDSESLLSISLASRVLRGEGQRILFRTMYLPIDMEAHIKFLTAVTSSSLLARYVEEFQQFELLDTEHQQEPLWELTCRGLNAMVNLKYLLFQALNSLPCAHILRGCTFRLEILRWQNDRDEEQLLEFLTTQPNLRILGVTWTIPTLNTSGICPGLQVLHGNQRAIDAFLPGRSITSLKWSAVLEELRIDAPKYSPPQEFQHLRYFSYGGYLGRPLINVVAPHLPVLEVFELVGLHLIEEIGWISEIPMLRVFILSSPSPCDWESLLPLEEYETDFSSLFELCKNLQRIDINIEERIYQRWLRDGSSPSYISNFYEVLLPDWDIS